jgi:hypothetical protein
MSALCQKQTYAVQQKGLFDPAKMVEAVRLVSYGTDIFDIVPIRELIDHG